MAPSSDPSPAAANDSLIHAAIQRALQELHHDASWAGAVRRLFDAEDEQWRNCCGSQCDPCVEDLARVLERARALLAQ